MADFVNPGQVVPPDVLGNFIRGQMSGYQAQGAQQSLQAGQQDLTKGALNIQQLQLALQNNQALSGYARQRLAQQQSGQNQGGSNGGIQNGPQSAVAAPDLSSPGGMGPSSYSSPGFDPQTQSAIAMLTGGDPVKAAKEASDYNLEQHKLQAQGPLDTLDTMISNPKPALTVMSNPTFMAGWPKAAAALGMDPVRDFNDDNVRRALIWGANKLRGTVGMDAKAYDPALQTGALPDGRITQTDPVTHKMTIEAPSPMEKVMGPSGRPALVPTAQSGGMTPFSPELYSDPDTINSQATAIAGYRQAPLTGTAVRSPQGQALMAAVQQINPNYDATKFSTKQNARNAFATGTQGNTVRSLSVATDHLNQLQDAGTALANGDVRTYNSIANKIASAVGKPNITSFNAMREIVGDEVVKSVVGSAGAEGDRQAIKEAFADANSPQQLASVVSKFKGLMGSQLNGLRRQYQNSTGLDDFDGMVSGAASSQLNGAPGGMPIGQSQNVGGFKVTRIK